MATGFIWFRSDPRVARPSEDGQIRGGAGYQLYGARVVPGELVKQLTDGDGEYGLGTMLFSQTFGLGTAYGHRGSLPDYSSLLVTTPEHEVSVAVILADGNKRTETVVTELVAALQPLLGK